MNKYSLYFCLIKISIYLSVFLAGCSFQQKTIKKKLLINPKKITINKLYSSHQTHTYQPPITIWIHGTNLLNTRLFSCVFNGTPTLKLASQINGRYKVQHIAKTLNSYDPVRFPLETFYIFGWAGLLNADLREQTAHHLYTQLNDLISKYENRYHCTPRIQILTHSHGGNVALNLAKISNSQNTNIIIDTLVLLACPVQIRTMCFIDNPMFQRIYSLYSNLDFIQVIAPQLFKNNDMAKWNFTFPPFSKRCFPQRNHVKQVKMKINGNALWHNDFVQSNFLKLLPSIISELDTWTNPPSLTAMHTDITHLLSIHTPRHYFKKWPLFSDKVITV